MVEATLHVEVAYGLPERQTIYSVNLPAGATARDAIMASSVLADFTEIDLARDRIGVFSKPVALEAVLRDGDRVEIYRPLLADPKEVRRRRAEQGLTKKRTAPVRPVKA